MSDGPWTKYATATGAEEEDGPWKKYTGGGVDISSEKQMAEHPPVAQPLEMKPSYSALALSSSPTGADPHNPANPNLQAIPEEEREKVGTNLLATSIGETTLSPTVGEAVATGSMKPFARLGANLVRGYLGSKAGHYVGHDIGGTLGGEAGAEAGGRLGSVLGGVAGGVFGAKIPHPKAWLLKQVLSEAPEAAAAAPAAEAAATGETTVMTAPRLRPIDTEYTVDRLPRGAEPPPAYEPPVSMGTKPAQRLQTYRPEETQPIASYGAPEEPRRLRMSIREAPPAVKPVQEPTGRLQIPINVAPTTEAPPVPPRMPFTVEQKGGAKWAVSTENPNVRVSVRPTDSDTQIAKTLQNQADMQKQFFADRMAEQAPAPRLQPIAPVSHAFEPPPARLQTVGPGRVPVNQLVEENPLARSTEENPANVRFAGQPEQLEAAANRQHEYINGAKFHEAAGGDVELRNEAKKLTNNVETEEGRGSIQRAYQELTGKKAYISGAKGINAPGKMGRIEAINEMLSRGYTPKQILEAARTPTE
jgi:hypothetical protein